MKGYKFGLLILGLFSFFSKSVFAASSRFDIGAALTRVLTNRISIAGEPVEYWVVLATFAFLFFLLWTGAMRVFSDNKHVQIAVAAILSLIITFTTPFAGWFMGILDVSVILIVILLVLATLALFLWGFGGVYRVGAKAYIFMLSTSSNVKKEARFLKKESRIYSEEIEDLNDIITRIKNLPDIDDPAYDAQAQEIKTDLDSVLSLIRDALSIDKRRYNLEDSNEVALRLRKFEQKLIGIIEQAKSAVTGKRPKDAIKNVKKALNLIKNQLKALKKALKWAKKHKNIGDEEIEEDIPAEQAESGETSQEEGIQQDKNSKEIEAKEKEIIERYKEEYSKIINGEKDGKYNSQQSIELQENIWKEFFRELKELGYEDDQIKALWTREIA